MLNFSFSACNFAGVAIGGGWQALVAYINLGCYYVFGLPFGFLLGYKANLGVQVTFYFCLIILFGLVLIVTVTLVNYSFDSIA